MIQLARWLAASAAVVAVLGACDDVLARRHGMAVQKAEADGGAATDLKGGGVELGEYDIRAYYPVEAQKSMVRFVLYGAVADERSAEALHFVEDHRHRLRDQVTTATRMSPLTIFDEAELASFRRRLLVRLRRALPDLPIDDVYVSEFQLTVQSL